MKFVKCLIKDCTWSGSTPFDFHTHLLKAHANDYGMYETDGESFAISV